MSRPRLADARQAGDRLGAQRDPGRRHHRGSALRAGERLIGPSAAPPPARVLSLDQCADQYALALAPRPAIVGLSKRATKSDSPLRSLARGLPQRRATLESALAARPALVLRAWGGEARLVQALERRGIRVITIADATSFAEVASETRRVAAALGRPAAGERLVGRMQARLAAARSAWAGAPALYLTSGGQTAGEGTLVGAMMASAGMANAAGPGGYRAAPLERLALAPPKVVVAGFFDASARGADHWGPGSLMRSVTGGARTVLLPASILACPTPFSAEGATLLAAAARS